MLRKAIIEFEVTEFRLTGSQRSYEGYWKDEDLRPMLATAGNEFKGTYLLLELPF